MRLLRNLFCAVFSLAVAATSAHAATVYVDGTVSGCFGGPDGQACGSGAAHMFAGATVNLINPQTLTLGPGTYTITNAALDGYYSAWNFSGGWVWNWGITTDNGDGTGNVFRVGYAGGVLGSQSAMATSHGGTYGGTGGPTSVLLDPTGGPDNFLDTFTLLATTTLDFFVLDYYGGDNAGGIALNISGGASEVPLPAALPLLVTGLGGIGLISRRRKKQSSASRVL